MDEKLYKVVFPGGGGSQEIKVNPTLSGFYLADDFKTYKAMMKVIFTCQEECAAAEKKMFAGLKKCLQ
jgi:hypothetical protein